MTSITTGRKPGRPKVLKAASRINVSLDGPIKRRLQKIAFDRQVSVSALIAEWVEAVR